MIKCYSINHKMSLSVADLPANGRLKWQNVLKLRKTFIMRQNWIAPGSQGLFPAPSPLRTVGKGGNWGGDLKY